MHLRPNTAWCSGKLRRLPSRSRARPWDALRERQSRPVTGRRRNHSRRLAQRRGEEMSASREELLGDYASESSEHISELESLLLGAERESPSPEAISSILRCFH